MLEKLSKEPAPRKVTISRNRFLGGEIWAAKYGDQAMSSLPNCAWRDNGDLK